MRAGQHDTARSGARSPRFRRVPFVRDKVSDCGRASAPRIAVSHMLPSASPTASASASSHISQFNSSPRTIAVYALWPPSPTDSHNTRYQAGATPYLGRTCTGWTTPASLAHRRICLGTVPFPPPVITDITVSPPNNRYEKQQDSCGSKPKPLNCRTRILVLKSSLSALFLQTC